MEISTLLEQFERKMKRIGELKVDVVNLKKSMEGAGRHRFGIGFTTLG